MTDRLGQQARRLHTGQRGAANIGAMLLLVAVLAGGSMFGYAATHQGSLAALKLQATADAAIKGTGRVAILSGPLYVQDSNGDGAIGPGDQVTVAAMAAPGATDVDLGTASVHFVTATARYEVTGAFLGDGATRDLIFSPPAQLLPGEAFSVELTPEGGPTSTFAATMPPSIDPLMTLY